SRSPTRQGVFQPGRDGGVSHRVLGGSIAESGWVGPEPAAVLAKPSARGDRPAIRAGARPPDDRCEEGGGPERLPEAGRDRRYPNGGSRAMARESARAARDEPAA